MVGGRLGGGRKEGREGKSKMGRRETKEYTL